MSFEGMQSAFFLLATVVCVAAAALVVWCFAAAVLRAIKGRKVRAEAEKVIAGAVKQVFKGFGDE